MEGEAVIPSSYSYKSLNGKYPYGSTTAVLEGSTCIPTHNSQEPPHVLAQKRNRSLSDNCVSLLYKNGRGPIPIRKIRLQKKAQRSKMASSQLYGSDSSINNCPVDFASLSQEAKHNTKYASSRQLPPWAWKVLVNILGVRLKHKKRTPCISILLLGLTLLLACTFTVTGMVHTVYDIESKYSPTTLLIGSVNIVIGFGWISLGIYSHKLAGRLFTNRNFAESVRIHSRTFFKISAVGLLMFLSVTVIALNCYSDYYSFGPSHCVKIFLHPLVCHVMYGSHIAFGVMALTWNILVGCVLLSVCRTHTMGIRRFIKQLEDDAKSMHLLHTESNSRLMRQMDLVSSTNEADWFIWDDTITPHMDRRATFCEGESSNQFPASSAATSRLSESSEPQGSTEQVTTQQAVHSNNNLRSMGSYNRLEEESEEPEDSSPSKCLTNEEILISYWKISNRMRVTSKSLQRWLASWIIFVIIWCADYIVYWINTTAKVIDILQFGIPLLLLLIITTAYAEANGEGQRMIRCIFPTMERMRVLFFLNQQPLQMQVFNFSITYNAIMGVILAFSVAFASRMVLDEISKI